MVGVPFLVRRCEAGPSARIGWPLPCFRRKRGDDRRTEEEDEKKPRPRRAKRAEGEIAEEVESAGKLGEPGQHVLASRAMSEAIAQSRDQRTHPAAVRALDHRDVAAAQGARDLVRQLARPLGPGGAHRRRRRLERARVSGPAPNKRSTLLALRSAASSACIAAAFGPSSSMSPMTAMRRPLVRASPRRAARAPRASKRDWRCSFRR